MPAAKYGADAAVMVIDGPYMFFLAKAVVLRRRIGRFAARGHEC